MTDAHPSPISEGEIEEARKAARELIANASYLEHLTRQTILHRAMLLARAFLSRCGRDEAIEEAAKICEQYEYALNAAAHIRSLVSDDKERGSAAGAAPFDPWPAHRMAPRICVTGGPCQKNPACQHGCEEKVQPRPIHHDCVDCPYIGGCSACPHRGMKREQPLTPKDSPDV